MQNIHQLVPKYLRQCFVQNIRSFKVWLWNVWSIILFSGLLFLTWLSTLQNHTPRMYLYFTHFHMFFVSFCSRPSEHIFVCALSFLYANSSGFISSSSACFEFGWAKNTRTFLSLFRFEYWSAPFRLVVLHRGLPKWISIQRAVYITAILLSAKCLVYHSYKCCLFCTSMALVDVVGKRCH